MRYLRPVLAVVLLAAGARAAAGSQPVETVRVLVARADIPAGTALTEPDKLFKWVRYVKGDEPSSAVTSLDKVRGKTTLRALAEDQPVKEKDVGDAAALAPVIPKGMRAYALRLGAGGPSTAFLRPGSDVDVILTTGAGRGKLSEIVASKLRVLAVDAPPAARGRGRCP
jgi:pilus assembly protein CpaB